MLPEDPDRGSFEFWAKKCREYSGQSFLDSGGAYGYAFELPPPQENVDPVHLNFHDGTFQYAVISTAHWLHAIFDASDENAIALEQLLYWFGNVLHPDDHWNACAGMLAEDINGALEYLDVLDIFDTTDNLWYPEAYAATFGVSSEQMEDFPLEALVTVTNNVAYEETDSGFNTYNGNEDLSQVVQVDQFFEGADVYYRYAVVRVHTGCDVRGGYADPVVAATSEMDAGYFTWTVNLDCSHCHEQWDGTYWYSEAYEKMDKPTVYDHHKQEDGSWVKVEVPGLTSDVVREYQEYAAMVAAYEVQLDNGQLELPGTPPPEPGPQRPDGIGEDLILRLPADELPQAVAWRRVDDKDGYFDLLTEDELDGTLEADATFLRCPECGRYSVRVACYALYG
jgi:hypothetical protein